MNLDVVPTSYCDIAASAEYLPFRDNVFKEVLCSQVLEHLFAPMTALREINRILRADGSAEIDFPKPFFTNNSYYLLIEFLLNLPFIFMPRYIRHLYNYIRGIRNRSPRYFHRYIITPRIVSRFLELTEIEEFGDILLKPLKFGRKARLFRYKPQVNTALKLKCNKKN